MKSFGLRLLFASATALALGAATAPAAAQVQGPCTAFLNAVEADRVDSLSSPLLLGDDEALVFSGTDATGTQSAAVALYLGPAALGRATSSSGAPSGEFLVSLDLADVAPYGVGLLRIRATTDNCTVEAWLRLGDRLPFTTLVGLTGAGLALAGLTGQVSAVLARRRWSLPVAAAAGVATGAGGALLGQQFGRLQVSYPSLGACVALAVAVGVGLALLRRPRPEPDEASAAAEDEEPAVPARPQPRPARTVAVTPPAATEPAAEDDEAPAAPETAAAVEIAAVETAPAPARVAAPRPTPAGPFWCYVMSDVEVLHLDDYSRMVATLHPGTWYLAKREVSGWAQVVAADGTEGWVPRQALHREG